MAIQSAAILNVVFRCDASLAIGSGHVMRCLTLADALREQGSRCHFMCREHPGHLLAAVQSRGHPVIPLPALSHPTPGSEYERWLGCDWKTDAEACRALLLTLQPDWLVVDHYALDERWERALRPLCKHLCVIDDLADRAHCCDLLLDQTLGRTFDDYTPLTPPSCVHLLGAQHALLRPEFAQWRDVSLDRRREPVLRNLLINLGGVDKDNVTGRVLQALEQSSLDDSCGLTIVMGATAPHIATVQDQARASRFDAQVCVNVSNMAELMCHADLAIGAAGSTTWERCCLGLPAVNIVIAENQTYAAQILANRHIIIAVDASAVECQLPEIVDQIGINPTRLAELSANAAAVTDGRGALRVSEAIIAAMKDHS